MNILRKMFVWGTYGEPWSGVDTAAVCGYAIILIIAVVEVCLGTTWMTDADSLLKVLCWDFGGMAGVIAIYSAANIQRIPTSALKEQKFYTELLGSTSIVTSVLTVASHLYPSFYIFGKVPTLLFGILSALLGAIAVIRKVTISYMDWTGSKP